MSKSHLDPVAVEAVAKHMRAMGLDPERPAPAWEDLTITKLAWIATATECLTVYFAALRKENAA